MNAMTPLIRKPHRERGLSLVEMMIGCAIGLFLMAGATRLFVDHLQSHRRLLLQARLHQDLSAAMDLMARDLRRAGYWQDALLPGRTNGTSGSDTTNPYRPIEPAAGEASQVVYSASRDDAENGLVDANEAGGFRLASDTLQTRIGGHWQTLTDPAIVRISRLAITAEPQDVPLDPTACARLQIRRYRIALAGRSTSDPTLVRELHTTVRVRNDDALATPCP